LSLLCAGADLFSLRPSTDADGAGDGDSSHCGLSLLQQDAVKSMLESYYTANSTCDYASVLNATNWA
jgi:hypothetical protein